MTLFQILAVLLTLTAAFSAINYHFIKLPTMIGVMVVALIMSSSIIALNQLGVDLRPWAHTLLGEINFDKTLLQGMLSFLLFAGALHIDLRALRDEAWTVIVLATGGVVVSTGIVALLTYRGLGLIGLELSFGYCLVFGALISPTDPIAVLGILRQAKAPKSLEIRITGESLFNDGVGVVLFIAVLGIATGAGQASLGHIALLFVEEALGGIAFGLVIGWVTYRVLKGINNYQVEILITLALVTGGYSLASLIHTSGPIAIVVAGLLIGNQGRKFAMSDTTRDNLDSFWEIVDEILNAVLFLLIGLEVLIIDLRWSYVLAGLLAIPIVLASRLISVGAPLSVMRRRRAMERGTVRTMTWGGLRGGISVALALAVPPGPHRDIILTVTYIVVLFSILVQGMTVASAVKRWVAPEPST
ncbi:MAG: sodium:proton antiporter [Kofleriaceae bacterium]